MRNAGSLKALGGGRWTDLKRVKVKVMPAMGILVAKWHLLALFLPLIGFAPCAQQELGQDLVSLDSG